MRDISPSIGNLSFLRIIDGSPSVKYFKYVVLSELDGIAERTDGYCRSCPPLELEGKEASSSNSRKQEKVQSMRNVLASILEIGVACSEESPRERMNSCDVVKELHPIKLAD
ncbi:hypothetical protein H0E87_021644 [Populus deltoides]|uniref:Uncharacterized protein n=1 Tax=Populus deltoides TaxID=3696 RepID=A0A8T2XG30_POPDE|nr:hypothetical protein H0E87_021644 [Populus deltoides]